LARKQTFFGISSSIENQIKKQQVHRDEGKKWAWLINWIMPRPSKFEKENG